MARAGRRPTELRPVTLTRGVLKYAEGSCLIECGDTRVICAASVEDKVPMFLKGTGQGWVTAEYGMLPRSSNKRIEREAARGKQSGRTQEIQRLIGRSLRAVVDMSRLGERTIWIDCDVLQADGGTRTASITGSFVALVECLRALRKAGSITAVPVRDCVAAISVGIVKGSPAVDLNYEEDSQADVDMNLVMTGAGRFIEVQGTAERQPFERRDLARMLTLGAGAIRQLIRHQRRVLGLGPTGSIH